MSRHWNGPSPVRPSSFLTSPVELSSLLPDPDPDPEDGALGGSSSPSLGRTNNPRKRPAEEMVQYAEATARQLRLKLESTHSLKEYSQLLAPEQSIWLAGRLLAQNEVLSTLQAPEAVYHMPLTLEGAIDEYVFLVLLDPTASTYVAQGKTGPLHRLTGYLLKLPSSGLTSTIMADKVRLSAISVTGTM
ncbi:hypothetical protein DFH08DRAFT_975974 [Mycena albidolilacea]|uniref:Uncharacterized protein n=1 Tax=Mycena albidolilacea TaxID=1033008 RepID=A0AAD6Z469_9AGAR|nr:hypothetical protein DFH08DRAFT_975974 [Mycena albidolilacea]